MLLRKHTKHSHTFTFTLTPTHTRTQVRQAHIYAHQVYAAWAQFMLSSLRAG